MQQRLESATRGETKVQQVSVKALIEAKIRATAPETNMKQAARQPEAEKAVCCTADAPLFERYRQELRLLSDGRIGIFDPYAGEWLL